MPPADSRAILPAPTLDGRAQVRVLLPAQAILWFNGEATTQTGPQREFASPELVPGKAYTYEVKARWMQDGTPVERSFTIAVRANKTTTVDFSALPAPKE
jgi:uncharacterized protein (TIGR03000 family)